MRLARVTVTTFAGFLCSIDQEPVGAGPAPAARADLGRAPR
jgi:hypothetical protein